MLQKIKKRLKINNLSKVHWYFLKNKLFLTLLIQDNSKNYILLPTNITILKTSNIYSVSANSPNLFYTFISKWMEKFYKPLQKKLFFRGLGFKFKFSNRKKNFVELKLGFSHLVTLRIPKKEVKIYLIKKIG